MKRELVSSLGNVAEAMSRVRALQTGDPEVGAMPFQVPQHLVQLYENSCTNLSPEQQSYLANLLQQYKDVFSRSDTAIGRMKLDTYFYQIMIKLA